METIKNKEKCLVCNVALRAMGKKKKNRKVRWGRSGKVGKQRNRCWSAQHPVRAAKPVGCRGHQLAFCSHQPANLVVKYVIIFSSKDSKNNWFNIYPMQASVTPQCSKDQHSFTEFSTGIQGLLGVTAQVNH